MILQSIHIPAFPNQDRGPISGVYFIRRGDSGPVKIGFSANVRKRIRSLQTGSAEPLKLLAVAEGGEQTERFLHEQFARHRLEGEWFSPDASLLALIADLVNKAPPPAPSRSKFSSHNPWPGLRGELCSLLGLDPDAEYGEVVARVHDLVLLGQRLARNPACSMVDDENPCWGSVEYYTDGDSLCEGHFSFMQYGVYRHKPHTRPGRRECIYHGGKAPCWGKVERFGDADDIYCEAHHPVDGLYASLRDEGAADALNALNPAEEAAQ